MATETIVVVRIAFQEVELQRSVKWAGGKWNPKLRLWEIRYDQAATLGLEARIKHRKVFITTNPRKSKSL